MASPSRSRRCCACSSGPSLPSRRRAEILSLGVEVIPGTFADVKVGLSERTTFDSKTAKTFLTDEQIAACNKTSLIETVTIGKPRLAVAA